MPERFIPGWNHIVSILAPLLLAVATRIVRCHVERRCTSWKQWVMEGFTAVVAGTFLFAVLEAMEVDPVWRAPAASIGGWLGPEVFRMASFWAKRKFPSDDQGSGSGGK